MSITERIKKLEAKAFSLQESSTSPVDLEGARWCFGCAGSKPALEGGGSVDCPVDIEGARRVFSRYAQNGQNTP